MRLTSAVRSMKASFSPLQQARLVVVQVAVAQVAEAHDAQARVGGSRGQVSSDLDEAGKSR